MSVRDRIVKVLEEASWPLSTKQVAEKAGVSRNTAGKYLAVLEAEGVVHRHQIGRANLWRLRKKVEDT